MRDTHMPSHSSDEVWVSVNAEDWPQPIDLEDLHAAFHDMIQPRRMQPLPFPMTSGRSTARSEPLGFHSSRSHVPVSSWTISSSRSHCSRVPADSRLTARSLGRHSLAQHRLDLPPDEADQRERREGFVRLVSRFELFTPSQSAWQVLRGTEHMACACRLRGPRTVTGEASGTLYFGHVTIDPSMVRGSSVL